MKQPVFLDYTFLFDASSTWQHLFEFERSLADFFAAYGYEAHIIKAIEGQMGKRILLIEPIVTVAKVPPKQQSVQTVVNKLRDPKTYAKSK